MAMAALGKNTHYHFKVIQRRNFNDMAGKWFDRIDAEDVMGGSWKQLQMRSKP